MDIQNQNVKKPISNLSSALASIHLTNQQQHLQNLQNTNEDESLPSSDIEDEDIEISGNSVSNSNTSPSLRNLGKYQNHPNGNGSSDESIQPHAAHSNHIHPPLAPMVNPTAPASVISAPINLPQTQRQQQHQNPNQNHQQQIRQQQDHRNQFFTPHAMDIPMMPQTDEPPLDRIGLYIKNPPSEGISLFSHRSAPNGFKVAAVLSELGFKYKTFYLDFKRNEQRSPYYLSMNPNSRVPAIIDHDNNDHTIWESGAIIIYLCQRAGPRCSLWSADICEQSSIMSWLFFQASGHAPMIGQALHFRYFHPERIDSALNRYTNEVRRIYAVVEMRLAELREQLICDMEDDSERFSLGTSALSESKYFADPIWLVGNRVTVADLSFVTWNYVVDRVGIDLKNEFPEVYKWTQSMLARPLVKRALNGLESN